LFPMFVVLAPKLASSPCTCCQGEEQARWKVIMHCAYCICHCHHLQRHAIFRLKALTHTQHMLPVMTKLQCLTCALHQALEHSEHIRGNQ
jgi:hypothetical protein